MGQKEPEGAPRHSVAAGREPLLTGHAVGDWLAPGRPVALALGGGAARGMAHVGVLKAVEDRGLHVHSIAGTSFGAVIAALYALAGNALEVERIIRQQDMGELWRQALDFGLHKGALMDGGRLAAWLDRKFFLGATFAETQLPLAVSCTDVAEGSLVTLREGKIADAVRASCALPGFFAMVEQDGRVLMDGGFVEPVPFAALSAAPPVNLLGVRAGIDVERAAAIARIRRLLHARGGRAFMGWAEGLRGRGVLSRGFKGLALVLRSYDQRGQGVVSPPPQESRRHLLVVDPDIKWWDFHESPAAVAAGERAFLDLLEASSTCSRRRRYARAREP